MKLIQRVFSRNVSSAILSLAALLVLLLASGGARADGLVQYSYAGNPFTTSDLNTCPSVCSLTGSFTVAAPLAGGLSDATISPLGYSFSDGVTTFTQGNSSILHFDLFATDATGAITGWDIFIGSLDGNSLLATSTAAGFIDLTANFVTGAESDAEVAGSWTRQTINVPEPGIVLLVISGLFLLAACERRVGFRSTAPGRPAARTV